MIQRQDSSKASSWCGWFYHLLHLLHRRKRPSTRCLASQRAWKNGGLHAEPPGRTLNAPLPPNFFTFLSLRPSGRRALSTPSPPILQDTAHSCFPPRTPSAIPPTPCPASESFSVQREGQSGAEASQAPGTSPTLPQPAPSRARRLEAGERPRFPNK